MRTLSIDECRDHIAKSRQTEVDLCCFLQSITLTTVNRNVTSCYNCLQAFSTLTLSVDCQVGHLATAITMFCLWRVFGDKDKPTASLENWPVEQKLKPIRERTIKISPVRDCGRLLGTQPPPGKCYCNCKSICKLN